eukprot:gene9247-6500_t
MRCYYEVLEVSRKATYEEIRKAYKLKSLQYHPDKNYGNQEEAAIKFKEVHNAYAVLSNDEERAWYDSHREQILHGGENGDDPNEMDLFSFFTSSCYNGFDDTDEHSFYNVYREIFEKLRNVEQDCDERAASLPGFGNSTSPWSEVHKFYSEWKNFSSFRNFAWKDEYKVNEMEDRYSRRAAERINTKARNGAKKEFVQNVRELAQFVYRRDPRVEAELNRQAIEEEQRKLEKEKQEAERIKRRQKANKKLWAEAAEREEREEAERAARGEALDGSTIEMLYEKEREAKALMAGKKAPGCGEMSGFAMLDGDDEGAQSESFNCKACKKQFKNPNQWKEHINSNKHKTKIKQLSAKGIDVAELMGEKKEGETGTQDE